MTPVERRMVVMVKGQREGSEHCRTSHSKVVETASVASRAQGAAAKESDGGAGTEAAARQPSPAPPAFPVAAHA